MIRTTHSGISNKSQLFIKFRRDSTGTIGDSKKVIFAYPRVPVLMSILSNVSWLIDYLRTKELILSFLNLRNTKFSFYLSTKEKSIGIRA